MEQTSFENLLHQSNLLTISIRTDRAKILAKMIEILTNDPKPESILLSKEIILPELKSLNLL